MSRGSEVGSQQAAGGRGKLRTENSELRTGRSEILPNGWITTELGKIVLHRKGKKPEKTIQTSKDGYVPYILIDEMEGKAIRAYTDDRTVPIAKEKDILIVWDGSIGKTATGLSGAIGSTIAALTPIVIPSNFLETFLKLSKPTIEQTSRGTGLQHINQTTFWPLSFPLPPLNEQNRIVAKLDQIMPRIAAVKERLDKVPSIIKRFRQSVLTAAVTGKLTEKWRAEHPDVESAEVLLERIKKEREDKYKKKSERAKKEGRRLYKKPTNLDTKINMNQDAIKYCQILPKEWRYVSLAVITANHPDSIVDGPFGSSINVKEDYIESGVPVVRMVNIRPFHYVAANLKFIKKEKFFQLSRHGIKPGDVLLAKVGATIGDCCIYPDNNEQAMLSTTGSCRITVDGEIYLPRFLELQLNSYRQMLVGISSKTAQPFLNMRVIKAIPVPILTLKEQQEIVRQVDKLFALADRLESHYQKAKARVDKLSQSVLAKAFRGELVITEAELAEKEGRDFESAEKLLERILEEKAKLVGSRQRAVGGVRSARGSKGKQNETGGKKK
jgi:Restriction endonuclease S subunits